MWTHRARSTAEFARTGLPSENRFLMFFVAAISLSFTFQFGQAQQDVTKLLREIANEEVGLVKHVCSLDGERENLLDAVAAEVLEGVARKLAAGNQEVPQLRGFRYNKGTPAVFNLAEDFYLAFDKALARILKPEQISDYVQERQYRDEARVKVIVDTICELLVRKVELLPDQRARITARMESWVRPRSRALSMQLDHFEGLLLSDYTPILQATLNESQMRIWDRLPKQTLSRTLFDAAQQK